MKKRILSWLLLLLLLLGTAPRAEAETGDTPPPGKKLTVMVYMTGSDLEPSSMAATEDMAEMAASGIDLSENNLVVYTGGAEQWHSQVPEDANALLCLTEEGFQQVDTFPLLSMGSAESLSRFLNLAYERFPAEEYALILWDHGNGPVMGYCVDKLYENDRLTLPEMRQALEDSPFSAGNRLSFIGFDACLMASAELACMLGDYADYLIASQETEPNFGWNYAFLADCGKIPAKDLACLAVDDYLDYSEEYFASRPFFGSDVTLSVVDLRYASQLQEGICSLFRKASPNVLGQFKRIAVSRVQTRSFGRATTNSEYDLVDLRCLLEELSADYPAETAAIGELLDKMVVRASANTEQSCGLSLYFPFYNKDYYDSQWRAAYREMNVFPDYVSFLSRYEQTWLAADMQELYDTALTVERGESEEIFLLPLTQEQLDATAEGCYYILRRMGEGTYSPVYIGTKVTRTEAGLEARFDGNIIYFEDDFGTKDIPSLQLTNQVGSRTDYRLASLFVESAPFGSLDWSFRRVDLQLSADASDRSVEIKGLYLLENEDLLGSGKQTELDLSEWAMLLFVDLPTRYLTRAENGRILGIDDWTVQDSFSGTEISVKDNVHFLMEPMADDGFAYYLMFELTDVQGSKVCSEPYALQLADALSAPETDTVQLCWDEDCTASLERDGVSIQFRFGLNADSLGPMLLISAANGTDEPLRVSLDALSVNGISGDPYGMSFDLEPGKTRIENCYDLEELLGMSGFAEPIRMLISVENRNDYGTLFRNLPVELAGVPEPGLPVMKAAMMDALAGEQLLYAEGGLEVTLLGLGCYPDTLHPDPSEESAPLTLYYRVDNHSGEEHLLAFPALCINGAELSTGLSGFRDGICLKNDRSCYFKQTVEGGKICRMSKSTAVTASDAQISLVESIASVSALMILDGQGYWRSIALEQAGEVEKVEPRGQLLFEDETWRVYRDELTDGDPEHVFLWIENRTDECWSFYLYAGENSVGSDIIGPHAWLFLGAKVPPELQEQMCASMHFLRWEDDWRYYSGNSRQRDMELTVSETFCLSPEEGGHEG